MNENPSEGKVLDFKNEDDWNELLERVPESYFEKRDVPGLTDVMGGLKVDVPTTIYNLAGDDASGVAGLLKPDGEFVPAHTDTAGVEVPYWDGDENRYVKSGIGSDGKPTFKSWSFYLGKVAWNGVVNGSIDLATYDGDDADLQEERHIVKRRVREASLTGDWQTTGELWRAIRRGTGQRGGPEMGKIHLSEAA